MRGSTRTMQMDGWEFAVQEDWLDGKTGVIAKHRHAGLALRGFVETEALMRRHYEAFGPPIQMKEVKFMDPGRQLVIYGVVPSFARVDMMPAYTEKAARSPFEVFSPWAPDAEEIIVDPPTVAGLLEQIRSLQEPELAGIRKRNRLREYRAGDGREVVRAQILTLAA